MWDTWKWKHLVCPGWGGGKNQESTILLVWGPASHMSGTCCALSDYSLRTAIAIRQKRRSRGIESYFSVPYQECRSPAEFDILFDFHQFEGQESHIVGHIRRTLVLRRWKGPRHAMLSSILGGAKTAISLTASNIHMNFFEIAERQTVIWPRSLTYYIGRFPGPVFTPI